jgi:SP family galactose:H+ symporter-like MFS transporter
MAHKEHLSRYMIFVVTIACLGGLLFGYHTAIISGALIFLSPIFNLSIAEQGVLVSIILLGALAGALMGGYLADRLGRKWTIMLTAVLFILGSWITAESHSYFVLLLGRIISGIAVGIISVTAPLYLAEISPPTRRGGIVSAYQLAITLGILGAYLINYIYAEKAEWQQMFIIGILPAAIQLLALFFTPESPAWLFKNGRSRRAIIVLERLRIDRHWEGHIDEMKKAASSKGKRAWKLLFSSKLRTLLLIGVFISAFQQITGINTVIYYAPRIFQGAGYTSAISATFATLSIGIVNVLATLVSVWLLDRVGRRRLLLIGIAGMVVSLASLAITSFLHSSLIDEVAVIGLMSYVTFFAIGLGPITWVLLSEIYPLKVRGKAMTLATFINWLCNYFVSLTFPNLLVSIGIGGSFCLYGVISILAFWFVLKYVPETKGKSLEEIEILLQK